MVTAETTIGFASSEKVIKKLFNPDSVLLFLLSAKDSFSC